MTNIKRLIERVYDTPIEDLLRQMYIIDGLPVYKIAKEFGVAHTTVHRWLEDCKLHYKRTAWNKGLNKEEMQRIIDLNKE